MNQIAVKRVANNSRNPFSIESFGLTWDNKNPADWKSFGKSGRQFSITTEMPDRTTKVLQFWFDPLHVSISLTRVAWKSFLRFLHKVIKGKRLENSYVISGYSVDKAKEHTSPIHGPSLWDHKQISKSELANRRRTGLFGCFWLSKGDTTICFSRDLFLKIRQVCFRFDH
jgi:hypothetical protein